MSLIRTPLASLVLVTLGATTFTACAQQERGGNPPAPPPEAYAVCKGKTEGASVTLTMPDGKALQGTCRTMGGTLVAMPAGGPGGPGGPPPVH
ncbi:hypothetical protein CLU85_3084 [Acidovorax sp. 69]|uniref:hypothetical protein n=1 Tax=Acidovorax sp. 69 TaxID=2035202 RepID=UPI000C24DCBF|nr:hypothetical protein [Acidovorax sp. 69]PJI98270.1 hypothetical protein CLU85_3084 [Acidovorax sp. 69]